MSAGASAFIDMEGVDVVRAGRTVLKDIDLHVDRGEQVALLGPNGCGKSTLLKIISQELYPVAREDTSVSIFGRQRWDVSELRKRLGIVQNEIPGKPMLGISGFDAILTGFFSSSKLWPHLCVTQDMRIRAGKMLEELGAGSLRNSLFGEMSLGQQRRILIGRALVASAECLLLDEPSNGLDLASQRDLRGLLGRLAAGGTTIMLITHHIDDVIPEIKRVVLMSTGSIVADGTKDELLCDAVLSRVFDAPIQVTQRNGLFHAE